MNVALMNDLRSGMGLDEALKKHNTNLQNELYRRNEVSVHTNKSTKKGEDKNIYPSCKKFAIKKTHNCKRLYFGLYSTIEEARIVRDELIQCNWDKNQLQQILEKHNIHTSMRATLNEDMKNIRKTKYGTYTIYRRLGKKYGRVVVYYGTYVSLKDAQLIRDKLLECEWDKTQLQSIKEQYGIKNSQGV